jgi:hypothetical protein
MEIRRELSVPCSPERLFAWVEDLSLYPQWMSMVHSAERIDAEVGSESAWNVELRAHVGPFARSKQLRMIRTIHERHSEVVFERRELDGRGHAPWVLRAAIESPTEQNGPTDLTMELRYGGRLWAGAVLQRVLDEEVRQGSAALVNLVGREPRR